MNINDYRNRFYNLLESKLGNVKPLLCENEIDEDKIDLSNTYLNPEDVSSLKKTNRHLAKDVFDVKDTKSVSSIKGNQFKNSESSSGNEYGLTFSEIGSYGRGKKYKVNFPSEFISKYFSLPTSQVHNQLGPYGDEHGDKDVPMNVPIPNSDKETSVVNLLSNVIIATEGYPTNRTHFPEGIPETLRGTGLGYIIYESFIKYLGWGSSEPSASSLSRVVWAKLSSDPDFYTFHIESNSGQSIIAISKTIQQPSPDEIVKQISNHFKNSVGDVKLKLGDDLKNDYPHLANI
jgi:hypothetical protein